MDKLNSKAALTAVATALLMAGCGGGGDGNTAPAQPAPDPGQSVTTLVDFIDRMITNNSENSDPIDINALTLAIDDTAEPTPQ